MPYRSHRGMAAADPGGHRHSGSPGGSHGARIHRPDLSIVPETAAAPGPSERSGRGPPAPGGPPGKPDSDPAEEARLPVRTIQWYLRTFHQLKLSVGAIVRAVHQVARQAGPEVGESLERIRSSPVVHADETGWRENGRNGCVWTFSTPAERFFRGRGGAVVDEILGESFEGILVSDFHVACHHYPGLKQRCWARLLRDIHALKALYPEDAVLARWAHGVQRLYAKAGEWAAGGRPSLRGQLALEERLLALYLPFLEDPLAVQAKLCRRIERHIKELFVFVSHPEAPSDNNAAERSLRHLVISRKISGGTRSEQGSDSKMTLAPSSEPGGPGA